MTSYCRLIPSWPLPPYIFVPGKNPHPKKTGGHMESEADPVALPIDPARPHESEFLRFALDLYNLGYYWESHVYLEALWNAHGRTGPTAVFLKALIKLGAAGVKLLIGQEVAAQAHVDRARELLEEVRDAAGGDFLGFDLDQLLGELEAKGVSVRILPKWT